jgi:sugar lactone lactonase YvrE
MVVQQVVMQLNRVLCQSHIFVSVIIDTDGSCQRSYAFDVDPTTQTLLNRRVLAYIDSGIPDGIELDTQGNIYTACSDGVQVRINTSLHRVSEF